MCGLVAMISKRFNGFFNSEVDIFKQMLYADALRGWDATGLYGVNRHGNVDIYKQAVAAGTFLNTAKFNQEIKQKILNSYRMVIGHNRKATHGEKRNEDAHPFWDDNGKVVLVHNGMISNHKELCNKSTVDSAAFTQALAKNLDNPLKLLGNIDGAFAFIWYDIEKKKLFFTRNDSRPLYVIESEFNYFLSSEEDLATWILKRQATKVDIKESYAIKPYTLYSLELDAKEIKEEGTYKKKVTLFLPTTTYQSTQRTHTHNHSCINGNIFPLVTQKENPLGKPLEFLTDLDIKTVGDVQAKYKLGDQICIMISSYEPRKTQQGQEYYFVNGSPININKDFISIGLSIDKKAFDNMDLCAPYKTKIVGSKDQTGKMLYFCKDLQQLVYKETKNETIITKEMWENPIFPNVCDVCGSVVYWQELDKSNVWLEDYACSCLCCPNCSKG